MKKTTRYPVVECWYLYLLIAVSVEHRYFNKGQSLVVDANGRRERGEESAQGAQGALCLLMVLTIAKWAGCSASQKGLDPPHIPSCPKNKFVHGIT